MANPFEALGYVLQNVADPSYAEKIKFNELQRRDIEQSIADRQAQIEQNRLARERANQQRAALGTLSQRIQGVPQEGQMGPVQPPTQRQVLGELARITNDPAYLVQATTPAQEKLVEVYDPQLGTMTRVPESQAVGMPSVAPEQPDLPENIVEANYLADLQQRDPERYERINKFLQQGALKPEDRTKIEKDLRNEFTNLNKDFIKVRDAFGKITSADPSPAGDISLLINFMKILDPGSVVREGEFATAQNAAGVPQRLRNVYNQALEGTRLSDAQRVDFLTQAQNLYESQKAGYDKLAQTYTGLAERAGVDVEDVVLDFAPDEQSDELTPEEQAELQRLRAKYGK